MGGRRPFLPVLEVAHNQLLRIGVVRRWVRCRHATGVLVDDQAAREVYRHLTGLLPLPVAGARVLELGPGRGTGLMRAALDAGVGSYAAVDVVAYLTADELPEGVDYRIASDGALPWPDGSFDLVWSVSVLEHVRQPEMLLAEVHRVLRPGGYQVADLGLYDHYHGRHDHDRMYQMLRYPAWLWDAMTSRRSSWVNRIRWSGWLALFEEAGFSVVRVHERREPVAPELLRSQPYLAHLSDDDLLVASADVVLRR